MDSQNRSLAGKHPFSLWLISARTRKGWSQQRLAGVTGMDQGYISKLENYSSSYEDTIGKKETVQRLAEALLDDHAGAGEGERLLGEGLHAAGFSPRGAVLYELNPSAVRIVEAYDNASADVRRAFEALAGSVNLAGVPDAAELAERADRELSIGKRADLGDAP